MQSALDPQSTSLDMLRSTTVGHFPRSALKLHSAETTTSASQIEATVDKFPENRDGIKLAACLEAASAPDGSIPNADADADFVPTFADSMCPDVTAVNMLRLSTEYYVKTAHP
jgi:hypothetical protein